jgi:3-oxo-5-alpha-steroid 4-dehydrogenase 1
MITLSQFNIFLIVMACIAVVVFVSLFFVDAGYGKFYDKKWGPAINNKVGWVLMEAPVFIAMLVLWLCSDRRDDLVRMAFLFLFELHYIQRSFVFPFRLRGKSVMPFSIIVMGVTFNVLNALMQGGWIFYLSPDDYYGREWLTTPKFIAGFMVFIVGMYINIQSDDIIRNLRKEDDTRHYLPTGGMFRYVTSANYFGELVEWIGFAILTWSWSGAVFALWTFANLAPRASRIYDRYKQEFGNQLNTKKTKRMIPFIW